jgi:hypothetical protein
MQSRRQRGRCEHGQHGRTNTDNTAIIIPAVIIITADRSANEKSQVRLPQTIQCKAVVSAADANTDSTGEQARTTRPSSSRQSSSSRPIDLPMKNPKFDSPSPTIQCKAVVSAADANTDITANMRTRPFIPSSTLPRQHGPYQHGPCQHGPCQHGPCQMPTRPMPNANTAHAKS